MLPWLADSGASTRDPSAALALGRLAADELVEAAVTLLVEEDQAAGVELPEEVLPRDRLELLIRLSLDEVDAENADLLAAGPGSLDGGGPAAARLGPLADRVV